MSDLDNMEDDPMDLDIYTDEGKRPCPFSRQVTVHVAVMALAGVVYLCVGGLAGYYIGKSRKLLIVSVDPSDNEDRILLNRYIELLGLNAIHVGK